MKMKTWLFIMMVVLLHCGAICALLALQGCGTTRQPEQPPAVVMPPLPQPERVTISHKEYPVEPVMSKEYKVRTGDSISKIAQRFKTSQAEIIALNKLSDPNKIRVGQTLLLPAYVDLEHAPASAPTKAAAKAPAPVSGDVYEVQSGDSISKIAKRLGVSEDDLVLLNNLADRNKIKVGQKLAVPSGARKPTAPAPVKLETKPAVAPEPRPTFSEPDPISEPVQTASIEHVVELGQDLEYVASLYLVTVDELAQFNGLAPNAKLEPGMRLKIP